jgi:hypothetical protein
VRERPATIVLTQSPQLSGDMLLPNVASDVRVMVPE